MNDIFRPCKGTGLSTETVLKNLTVAKYTEHDSVVQFEHEGNQSVYLKKGEDGHLLVRFNVESDETVRREGLHIVSKHFITLTEALLGCTLSVNTVQGAHTIELKSVPHSGFRYTISNKGIGAQGDHIAEIEILMPQNLDQRAVELLQRFAALDPAGARINKFDPDAEFYQEG